MSLEKSVSKTLKVKDIKSSEVKEMFAIFSQYYTGTTFEIFHNDLMEKSHVFLAIGKKTGSIFGFSTIKEVKIKVEGKRVIGYFSGDTIVDKRYWGKNGIGAEFSKFMVKKKLSNPTRPIYWNLISKGYKTYLLLTNNFSNYYPRADRDTPKFEKKLIDTFASKLYPKEYNPNSGLISFSSDKIKDKLKGDVCEITKSMRAEHPNIDFFEKANPNWRKGDELVCIGEFQLKDGLNFVRKKVRKSATKLSTLGVFQVTNFKNKRVH